VPPTPDGIFQQPEKVTPANFLSFSGVAQPGKRRETPISWLSRRRMLIMSESNRTYKQFKAIGFACRAPTSGMWVAPISSLGKTKYLFG